LPYTYHSAVANQKIDFAAVALGSKLLSRWIAEQVSETAAIALAGQIDESGSSANTGNFESLKGELFDSRLVSDNRYLWLFASLLLAVAIYCLVNVHDVNKSADDGPSGLLWDIGSIASKAALLARSRIRESLSSPTSKPSAIHAVPALRMGHWRRDEDNYEYDWRIDSRCNEIRSKSNASSSSPLGCRSSNLQSR
jgi:hypothetical protein